MAMSETDDASYSDFLRKANAPVGGKVEEDKDTRSVAANIPYLQSETDEPWTEVNIRSAKIDTAQQFADLVRETGQANFADLADDAQYEQASKYVTEKLTRQELSATKDSIEIIEIRRGTRILVFCVIYDHERQQYSGLRSLKIES